MLAVPESLSQAFEARSVVGRATSFRCPTFQCSGMGKLIVISIFNHRNVGHKQHAQPF